MTTQPLSIDDDLVVWSALPSELGERPLVLLLHGRGSHEHDLVQLVPMLLPQPVYASLRAPMPFRGGEGFSWFPPADPGLPRLDDADAAADAVLGWLDRIAPAGPVSVVGFSQGGAIALHLMRTAPTRFASFVNLSGFAIEGAARSDTELLSSRPPVFWGRDVDDPMIPEAAIEVTEQFLPAHSTLRREQYGSMAHSISLQEVADVRAFLQEHGLGEQGPAAPGATGRESR